MDLSSTGLDAAQPPASLVGVGRRLLHRFNQKRSDLGALGDGKSIKFCERAESIAFAGVIEACGRDRFVYLAHDGVRCEVGFGAGSSGKSGAEMTRLAPTIAGSISSGGAAASASASS